MELKKIIKKAKKYIPIIVLSSILFSLVTLLISSFYHAIKGVYCITLLLLCIAILFYPLYIKSKKYLPFLCTIVILLLGSSLSCIYRNLTYQDIYYHGIDISKWDGDVNLKDTTLDFVIIRCGYTSNVDGKTIKPDSQFEQNIKQCKELGIPYGIYYYSCATNTSQAKKEAEYTLSVLKEDIPPLGVYYDTEDPTYQEPLSKEQLTSIALSYVQTIEDKGIKAGIYANYYWWNNKLDHKALDTYLKWVAIYDEEYSIEDMYAIHQYSDTGTIHGIDGEFDVNITKNMYWLE